MHAISLSRLASRSLPLTARHYSAFSGIEMGPPDPIIGLNETFKKETNPNKVNVGVGAYRDDNGKPWVLPCVREADAMLQKMNLDHEYAPISGDPVFVDRALQFAYGADCPATAKGRISGVQTLSGTGGLRIFGEYLAKFHPHKAIHLPNPTWGNHIPIMKNSGLQVNTYRYYDPKNSTLDFDGLLEDIDRAPNNSCFLLHACAHNPTGMDPTKAQWGEISDLMKKKSHLPFFDCAYQGFASGSADEDAYSIRKFVEDGHHFALVQSFSKNFGLYGQRVGALSIVGQNKDEAAAVQSQFKILIRPNYSNPPRYGAKIVSTILGDERLTEGFRSECKSMADRINAMRTELKTNLVKAGSTRNWDHVTTQIGMFAFSGLTKEEVIRLRDEYAIYCTLDGRISMAGVTSGNVEYIAKAMHSVTKQQ